MPYFPQYINCPLGREKFRYVSHFFSSCTLPNSTPTEKDTLRFALLEFVSVDLYNTFKYALKIYPAFLLRIYFLIYFLNTLSIFLKIQLSPHIPLE